MALDALARGDYERFHDFAWRTVQTGSVGNPDLMYMLARAQSLSGRPRDAFVMLGRLADMGVGTDAAMNDEFRAVRMLRDWPQLEALIATVAASAPGVPPSASNPVSSSSPLPVSPSIHATLGRTPRALACGNDRAGARFHERTVTIAPRTSYGYRAPN